MWRDRWAGLRLRWSGGAPLAEFRAEAGFGGPGSSQGERDELAIGHGLLRKSTKNAKNPRDGGGVRDPTGLPTQGLVSLFFCTSTPSSLIFWRRAPRTHFGAGFKGGRLLKRKLPERFF